MRPSCLVLIFCLLSIARPSFATVYDGGTYDISKVSDHTTFGSQEKEPAVVNFAAESERNSLAPVGKPFYVLGEDKNCYWGNFAYSKYEKALIVYTKTHLPNNLCIYQEKFDRDPIGYSLSSKDGGICVATKGLLAVSAENGDKVLEIKVNEAPAPLSKCLVGTDSYGRYLEEKGIVLTSTVSVALLPKPSDEKADTVKTRTINSIITKTHAYTIQLGAYLASESAEKQVSLLRNKGLEAFKSKAIVNGKTYYRVTVGQFVTYHDAVQKRKKVTDESGVSESLIRAQ